MLELAKERSLGAHPYFVPVQHTARARQILGRGPLLAPEVTVVLESDPAKARALARTFTELYLTLPNYTNNLRSFGFTDDDLAGAGSDRLVDAVVCWGDVDTVVAKIRAHHEAGADHVCIQMVSPPEGSFPLTQYRELATALFADSGGLNQPEKKARPRTRPIDPRSRLPMVTALDRAGPAHPCGSSPPRREGSVRRTTSIDSSRPGGMTGPIEVDARARDLETGEGPTRAQASEQRLPATIGFDRTLTAIESEPAEPRLSDLLGTVVGRGFRAHLTEVLGDHVNRRTLLHTLLDDLPGAILVSGYAMQRGPAVPDS